MLSFEDQWQIVREFKMCGDLDEVAEVMKSKGLSFAEVERVVSDYLRRQRRSYASGSAICLFVGLALGVAVAVFITTTGKLPLKLAAMSGGVTLSGVYCLYRTFWPK